MSNEYTPSLEEVRENYGWNGHDSYIESNRVASRAEFDRFIKRYRAEAKAEALEEAYYYGLGRTGHSLHSWLRVRAEQYKESE